MSKQLYEEALADVKKVTQVAEDNAKRAILEVVTPRIRELIERELLGEGFGDEDEEVIVNAEVEPGLPSMAGRGASPTDAITSPDAEGKVTLDLDALGGECGEPVEAPMFGEPHLGGDDEEEYVLGLESLESLKPMLSSTLNVKKLQRTMSAVNETILSLKAANKTLRESAGFSKQITRTISQVENMYEYVQERISDPSKKKVLEQKLETYFRELTKLQELKMSRKLKDLIKEDDTQLDLSGGDDDAMDMGGDDVDAGAEDDSSGGELTLKLTGLGDVDIDNVGVDLVSSDDEGADEDGDIDLGGDDDMGGDDLDLGGAEGGDEPGDQMESMRLSDDTIVEIDEGMLRREIARMKKIRESSEGRPDNGGQGVDAAAMDDFGGGADEGEMFLDGEVTTAHNESEDMDEGEDLDESDDAMDESDDAMDEADMPAEPPPVAETQNRRKADEHGVSANSDMQSVAYEGLQRKAAFETRLQEGARKRAAALKKEAARSKGAKKAAIIKEYKELAVRYNASIERSSRISKRLTEVKKLKESRSNSVAQKPAESKAFKVLRTQLSESNLFSQKLIYCNKILQNESLSKRQKAQCVDRLDEAKTLREAKLVYESLMKALSKPLREGRTTGAQILGSASRTTRPASTPTLINEGFETDRWATLAGITKK